MHLKHAIQGNKGLSGIKMETVRGEPVYHVRLNSRIVTNVCLCIQEVNVRPGSVSLLCDLFLCSFPDLPPLGGGLLSHSPLLWGVMALPGKGRWGGVLLSPPPSPHLPPPSWAPSAEMSLEILAKQGAGAPVLQEHGRVETSHWGGRTKMSPTRPSCPPLPHTRARGGGSVPLDAQSAGVGRGQRVPGSVRGRGFRQDEPWSPPRSVHSEATSASDPHAVTSVPSPCFVFP